MNNMKILLLDPKNLYSDTVHGFVCLLGDATIITGEQVDNYSSDSATIDIIIGGGDFTNGSKVADQLLAWRTHPYTYLVPCWILSDQAPFAGTCLWPNLSIDRFSPKLLDQEFCGWLTDVAEWQQTRMHMEACNTLQQHSCLELLTSLALRKASGRLSVFDEEGGEGYLLFRSGCLAGGLVKHISGGEAFFEFLTWGHGSYCWEASDSEDAQEDDLPLDLLIQDGLRLIREANVLYHFMPDLDQPIRRTESQSALHDGAAPFFTARKELYYLIDGSVSAARLLEASPLSRPRTMSILAQWFSMDDIALVAETTSDAAPLMVADEAEILVPATEVSLDSVARLALEATLEAPVDMGASPDAPVTRQYRLLIVDDSALMCRALHEIFSSDPRFEIVGVAHDGIEALAAIDKLRPDVVTLDIQMPRMDGLTTLKHIMIRGSLPVVILSAFTKETSQFTYESFKYGAVDVCTKPVKGRLQDMEAERQDLRDRVAEAAVVHMDAAQYIRRSRKSAPASVPEGGPMLSSNDGLPSASRLVVIGCGAGGFPSLLRLMFAYSWDDPSAISVVCLAMPQRVIDALLPNLVKDLARCMESLVPGAFLEPGVCYLVSSDSCFRVVNEDSRVKVEKEVEGGGPLRPLDCLLSAASRSFGEGVAASILSGVGDDGLVGLQAVKQQGGRALVLTPEVCLKRELPRRILEQGWAEEVRTVAEMAGLLWGGK
jgi:two-component system, chemotaxis family, protein-glutamate methylesterase/glutaminase